ncbi:hypothetical protein [Rhizobium sp. BK176]|uniref:hypothetical protein n=1 Tax=Rhizobium sp. BK176 TaxID=2587071 RepID=UPI002169EAC0|nr:hypothetical protein [Rhizobium sp. BK176]MCS4088957.1 hypothetical protein [Rhizobium sp. BK176]
MKTVLAASLLAMLISVPALAQDKTEADAVKDFVEFAYPRITTFEPSQGDPALQKRIRYFADEKALSAYVDAKTADGTIALVFGKGGQAIDDIISKVSVSDRGNGDWQADFIARHKSLGPGVEDAECISVRLGLKAMPLGPGISPVAIDTVTTKPSKVKCPVD